MRAKLYVSDGRVNCPRRGDIDIDTCFACAHLDDVQRDGDDEVVICTPRVHPALDRRFFFNW